jgi:hypothetical protein
MTKMAQFFKRGVSTDERPNLIGSPKIHNKSLSHWFNTSAFAVQTPFTFGNSPTNLIEGPRQRDVDAGLDKTFSLAEGFKLQFRAEAFNLTNTPDFSTAGGGPNPGTFGIASSDCPAPAAGCLVDQSHGFGVINSVSNSSREFQFGLKLTY